MITRVSAEFETPEIAELAVNKVRDTVGGILSTGMMYNRSSEKAVRLRNGCMYTIIPTAVTSHNYITAVMESTTSEDVIPEPSRNRKATLYVICESGIADKVTAVFNSCGGLSVKADI